MNPVKAIALSGLNAAARRVEVSASNIANQSSRGALPGVDGPAAYTPLEVQLAAQAGGGVSASIAPSSRATLIAYDPQSAFANARGYVAAPAIDLTDETINLALASYDFAANLAVIRTANDMTRAMLEMRA